MPSYMENGYLEDAQEHFGADLDAGGATTALTEAPGEAPAQAPVEVVRIGQLVVKKSTLILVVVVVALVALYVYSTKRSRKSRHADA